jgi:glycine/D-amino acid oxidase-like deaminating enzyme
VTLSRREFLGVVSGAGVAGLLGAPPLIGLTRKSGRVITGGFADDGMAAGHALRDGTLPVQAARMVRVPVVIVGGGIAGLSAAWELDRRGMHDFAVLELLRDAGGNARSGRNDVSEYPWAAHYIPVPGKQSKLVRELLAEIGVLHADGTWDERALCFSPQERHHRFGEWHAGLEPDYALTARERDEFDAFEALMDQHRNSGQFTIPLEQGLRRDSPLDRITFSQWIRASGFRSETLKWYADYACRDDYGALASETSAWAGVHYFASRQKEEQGPLTWPAGNGWIVRQLLRKLDRHVRTDAAVVLIERDGRGWKVSTRDTTYRCDSVIYSAPRHLAPYVIREMAGQRTKFVYSPWLTANLTLERWPKNVGVEPAWDNVIYGSPALGYVVATHQSLATREDRTVWTFYWALAHESPSSARNRLLKDDWRTWTDRILDDLSLAHPDIRDCVSHVDIMRHGHAMIRPTPGFLTEPERAKPPALPGLYFAHSDASGISIFEEAQYQGVGAARAVMGR